MQDAATAIRPQLAQTAGQGDGAPAWFLAPVFAFGVTGFILQAAVIVFQVICVVHVIRRREDYWWIFLVLFFPFVGSLVYFIVVMWPDLRQRTRWRRGAGSGRGGNARGRIRHLERQVALTDTVDGRAALAGAYCEAGQYVLARQCYEGCLQGLYADDAHLLFGLAQAVFGEGNYQRCLDCIARVARQDIPEHLHTMDFLKAKALLALGRDDEADAALRALAPKASTLEVWWRLAELLARRGEDDEADRVCRRLLEDGTRLGPASRKRDKEWIALAKGRLKARARPRRAELPGRGVEA